MTASKRYKNKIKILLRAYFFYRQQMITSTAYCCLKISNKIMSLNLGNG